MPKLNGTGTEGSGQSTVTETASAEEKAAVSALENDDTSWDDGEEVESRFEAKDEDDSAATDEDDSDVEESDDDVESEDDSDDADSEEEESTEDENDQDAEDSDATEDADTTDIEAERKRHNDEMAQARIAERKARDEAEKLRKERQEERLQQYLDEAGEDDVERQRRENDVEQFRIQEERIELNHERLQSGINRALVQVELFATGSQAAKEELINAVDDFEREFVEKDKQGRPVRIKVDPRTGKQADVVNYLQRKADSIKRLQGEGVTQQVRSKAKEKSRVLTPPVRAPRKAKVDSDLAAFDDEASR